MSASEVMLVMNHAHLVVEELKQGPKTVTELADACNLTESRIREVLDFGTDDGMIYPVDTDTSAILPNGTPSTSRKSVALRSSVRTGSAFCGG